MGLIRCPFCEQEIDTNSKKCFFCDSDLSQILHYDDSKQNQEKHETLKTEHPIGLKKITLFLLLGAAFLGMAFFLIGRFD